MRLSAGNNPQVLMSVAVAVVMNCPYGHELIAMLS